MFNNMPFYDSILDADVIRHMGEASEESPNIACSVNPNVSGKEDVPLLMNLYTEAMDNYTEIKNAPIEEEEVGNTVNRLVMNIDKDTKETSPSVIMNLARQLEDLRRRMLNVINMTDREVKFSEVTFKSEANTLF